MILTPKLMNFLKNFLIIIYSRLLIVLLKSPLILLLYLKIFLEMFLITRLNLVFVFLISLIIILFFKLQVRFIIKNRPCRTNNSRSFTPCNMRTFVNRIELADWNDIISVNSVNQAYRRWQEKPHMCFWPLNMHFAKIRSCYVRGFVLNMFRGQRHMGSFSCPMTIYFISR